MKRNSVTRSYKSLSEKDKVEIAAYYKNHSYTDTCVTCRITHTTLDKIMSEFNLSKHTRAEALNFTHIKNYGSHEKYVEEMNKNVAKTSLERFGASNYFKTDEFKGKTKETSLKKYGTECPMKSEEVKKHLSNVFQEKYGAPWPMNNKTILEKRTKTNNERYGGNGYASDHIKQKCEKTCLEKYGFSNPMRAAEIKEHLHTSVKEKYGVDWYCMHPNARTYSTNNSKPNKEFEKLLTSEGIPYEREFSIENKSYDFKVGNVLIEIDPTPTHNINWSPFDKDKGVPYEYHEVKSKLATDNGYRCIHIWDWDDKQKVIATLMKRERIYARDCNVRFVEKNEYQPFLIENHLQGTAQSSLGIGLYKDAELVSVMTFGKPRYNKNYQWELVRYCSKYFVVGGAEKLFKFFVNSINPLSIVSYCDLSKFEGKTYERLGFRLKSISLGKHWFNMKTRKHITDNLLRQRGFDQLLGDTYGRFGKGTSNEELMRNFGFDEIIDAGQATYVINL